MLQIFFEYKGNIKGYWNVLPFVIGEKRKKLNLLFSSFNVGDGYICVEDDDKNVYIQDLLFLDDFGLCPTLELSKDNYNQIIAVWNDNINNPAPYLVLSQDDTGWINLERKTELSPEDLKYIEQEKLEQQIKQTLKN